MSDVLPALTDLQEIY